MSVSSPGALKTKGWRIAQWQHAYRVAGERPEVLLSELLINLSDTDPACPAFAYHAIGDAFVIERLKAAGAILVGKTNLDQFATGLVGTRSPYGAVPNTFNPAYISGGSSSGSASVVARGLVPFALGTDTAGSGRVPAAFNNIVGIKPTKGWVSGPDRGRIVRLCCLSAVFAG